MAAVAGVIIAAAELVDQLEQAKEFWDQTGLDMHIAVKKDGRLAVSTKHWSRVHYIRTGKTTEALWDVVQSVGRTIGRSLVRSEQGPYVYIPKLNVDQTQAVFDLFKDELGHENVERVLSWSWKIEDAVLPRNR